MPSRPRSVLFCALSAAVIPVALLIAGHDAASGQNPPVPVPDPRVEKLKRDISDGIGVLKQSEPDLVGAADFESVETVENLLKYLKIAVSMGWLPKAQGDNAIGRAESIRADMIQLQDLTRPPAPTEPPAPGEPPAPPPSCLQWAETSDDTPAPEPTELQGKYDMPWRLRLDLDLGVRYDRREQPAEPEFEYDPNLLQFRIGSVIPLDGEKARGGAGAADPQERAAQPGGASVDPQRPGAQPGVRTPGTTETPQPPRPKRTRRVSLGPRPKCDPNAGFAAAYRTGQMQGVGFAAQGASALNTSRVASASIMDTIQLGIAELDMLQMDRPPDCLKGLNVVFGLIVCSSPVQTALRHSPVRLLGALATAERHRGALRSWSAAEASTVGSGNLDDRPDRRAASAAADADLKVFFTSLGGSSGPVFRVTAVNQTGRHVALTGSGIVLEPIARMTQADLDREVRKVPERARTSAVVNWYCLEMLKPAPRAGVVYRIANRASQERLSPMRRILQASRGLERAGRLHPDADPAYYHSIRQWAIWTQERNFDQQTFADAFVEHLKKNLERAGRRWTSEIETATRQLVPNRWRDIETILDEAEELDRVMRGR